MRRFKYTEKLISDNHYSNKMTSHRNNMIFDRLRHPPTYKWRESYLIRLLMRHYNNIRQLILIHFLVLQLLGLLLSNQPNVFAITIHNYHCPQY